ncbi:MAG: UDP-N-acetylmuramoyl-tripeptide--D-alanyl-D-alanine ligase [candidate division Zixibacteria bacterium]|nr:UDP-N-acetylmuramoyl-tripeptide--D-alanyl-D-alanine ligase [candidate division Zixibacteria bacterium]
MIEIRYKELLDIVKGKPFPEGPFADFRIKGLSIDSRTIEPQNLFIAIKGEKYDGHDFIKQALDKGASCVIISEDKLTDREIPYISSTSGKRAVLVKDTRTALQEIAKWYRDKFNVKVVAITGTNGKTTTKEMIAEVLSKKYKVLRSEKSFNNQVGVPLTLLKITSETEVLVLELGMNQPGEIGILTRMANPDTGLITNIGPAHLEFMGSLEKIAQAKFELLENMDEKGKIVLNADDPWLSKRVKIEKRKVYTFGLEKEADFVAKNIIQNGNGFFSFSVNNSFPITIKLLGKHNVYNALAAFSAASILKIEGEKIKEALENYTPFELRMELSEVDGIKILNDSYNANPTSMGMALETLKGMKTSGNKVAVLGDMLELGEKSLEFHKTIGEKVKECEVDYLFTFGGLSSGIAQGAKDKGFEKKNIFSFQDKKSLLEKLLEILKPGDVVLFKGSRKIGLEAVVDGLKKLYPVKS